VLPSPKRVSYKASSTHGRHGQPVDAVLKQWNDRVARIDHRAEAEGRPRHATGATLIFGNPKGGTPLMVASPTVAMTFR
jgi:hypothetical protein